MAHPPVDRPKAAAPELRGVALRAGVAPGTVSNVLTGRKPVADHLRQAVIEAVEALRYRPMMSSHEDEEQDFERIRALVARQIDGGGARSDAVIPRSGPRLPSEWPDT